MTGMEGGASTPDTVEAVRARILDIQESLPKRLRQCADHVVRHPEKIAVSTVADLAAGAGVPPSALIRFCQMMGFTGFSEMQRLFRHAYAERWPDYATRLDRLRDRDGEVGPLLFDFVGAGHKSLNILVETLDYGALERAVSLLRDAGTIHVVGLRRSFPVASYMAYIFEKMDIATILHDGVGGVARPSSIRAGDAMIAISFVPYTQETVALAAEASRAGVPVVAITDGPDSPLRDVSQQLLTVREVDVGAFRAMSATMSLAATIAVAVGAARSR